jgi:hypothetical protein
MRLLFASIQSDLDPSDGAVLSMREFLENRFRCRPREAVRDPANSSDPTIASTPQGR